MAARVEVLVGERTVTVRELTVAEVRSWIAEHEAGAVVDPLRAFVLDDCTLDDLARMSDITADDMERHTVGELLALRDKARALNPHFFKVREALVSVSRQIQAGLDSLNSTGRSPA